MGATLLQQVESLGKQGTRITTFNQDTGEPTVRIAPPAVNILKGAVRFVKNGRDHESLVFGEVPDRVAIHLESHWFLFPGEPEPESTGLHGTSVVPVTFEPA
jgi:hypothetical protein